MHRDRFFDTCFENVQKVDVFAQSTIRISVLSDFSEHLLHGVEHASLTMEFGAEDPHDFTVTQLFVLGFDFAFLAEDQ